MSPPNPHAPTVAPTNLHAATTTLTRTRLDHAHARIDCRDGALTEFDLIRGLTGLGATTCGTTRTGN